MKMITANKLNRFWEKSIKPIVQDVKKKFDSNKMLNTLEEIQANTSSGYGAGATAVKELYDELNTGMDYEDFKDKFPPSPHIEINNACVQNRMVFIYGRLKPSAPDSYEIVIPAGYRPICNLSGSYFLTSGNDTNCVLAVYMQNASTITIWTTKANTSNVNFSFLYPLRQI